MSERPAIVSIRRSELASGEAVVTIILSWQDAEYLGEAVGPGDAVHLPRMVGEATLRAVESVTRGRIRLHLRAVASTSLGETQVAMAQVELDGDTAPFVGSAVLEERDRVGATVRAVLDAINRRLERIL